MPTGSRVARATKNPRPPPPPRYSIRSRAYARVLQKERKPFLHNEMKRGAPERDAVDGLTYALWIPARRMHPRWHPSRWKHAATTTGLATPGAPRLDRTRSRVEPDRGHLTQPSDAPCASAALCLSTARRIGPFSSHASTASVTYPSLRRCVSQAHSFASRLGTGSASTSPSPRRSRTTDGPRAPGKWHHEPGRVGD